MNGNLLDTNVIIKLTNGDVHAVELMENIDDIVIPVITAGELYYGAQKSSRVDENMNLFNEIISEYGIVNINQKVSVKYGEIKADLVKRGINIPENDIWIAAIAITNEYTLVTFDAHFKKIRNLNVLGV